MPPPGKVPMAMLEMDSEVVPVGSWMGFPCPSTMMLTNGMRWWKRRRASSSSLRDFSLVVAVVIVVFDGDEHCPSPPAISRFPEIIAIALVGGRCACHAWNDGLRPRSGIVVRRA